MWGVFLYQPANETLVTFLSCIDTHNSSDCHLPDMVTNRIGAAGMWARPLKHANVKTTACGLVPLDCASDCSVNPNACESCSALTLSTHADCQWHRIWRGNA